MITPEQVEVPEAMVSAVTGRQGGRLDYGSVKWDLAYALAWFLNSGLHLGNLLKPPYPKELQDLLTVDDGFTTREAYNKAVKEAYEIGRRSNDV